MADITCVGDLRREIEAANFDPWGAHVRRWFRGHGDRSWRLEPGLYRAGLEDDKEDETDLILKERHLTQDFVNFSKSILGPGLSDAEIYFIQQHYRMPTRLLDWSGNPLAALWFATSSPSHDEIDGELFMLDSYSFKGGHRTARHNDLQDAMKCIFGWENSWPVQIYAVRPPAGDPRIIAQSAYFTFHPPKLRQVTTASNDTLRSCRIPAGSKKIIRAELQVLNFNEFTVYGGLDHLANWLKASYQK